MGQAQQALFLIVRGAHGAVQPQGLFDHAHLGSGRKPQLLHDLPAGDPQLPDGEGSALLFHGGQGLPPAVGCAALLADNVRVDAREKRIALRFRIHPMEAMNARELALLASDHARKILAPRFRQGDAERAFCRRLERGDFPSIVPLYAGWHRAVEDITVEYEALDQKNAFKRWFAFLWKNIKRAFRRNRR